MANLIARATMTLAKLALRSLAQYWKWNLSILLGAALTCAILSGSLVVGDSVRETLRRAAAERIGGVGAAMIGGDRFFTGAFAESLPGGAPAILVQGAVTTADGGSRANGVSVFGVEPGFWKLGGPDGDPLVAEGGGVPAAVGEPLAHRLGLKAGDAIIARLEIPGAISKDAPLSGSTRNTALVRATVAAIIPSAKLGRFSLRAEQVPALDLFLPLAEAQKILEKPGRCNAVFFPEGAEAAAIDAAAKEAWTLADAELAVRELSGSEVEARGSEIEVSSDRIFIDPPLAEAARAVAPAAQGALTYFANEFAVGEKHIAYSMISAVDASRASLFPAGMPDDGILLNAWAAEKLGAAEGDALTLKFNVIDGTRGLREESADFTVAGILPMDHPDMRRDWSPKFPGVTDVDNCRDWDPGFEIDRSRMTDDDQKYWDEYHATPKAFITLAAGQRLWSNRFGNLTSLRIQGADAATFSAALRAELSPATSGVHARDLSAEAGASVAKSMDFGALFASMSFFLIITALILTALLFAFGVEKRSEQIGLLMAVGLTGKRVRRALLLEALALSCAGALVGLLGGYAYTKLALAGLGGDWSGAVSGMAFAYHAKPATLGGSFAGAVLVSLLAVFLVARRVAKAQPKDLIAGVSLGEAARGAAHAAGEMPAAKRKSLWIGALCLLGGAGIVAGSGGLEGEKLAYAFFGGGALLLTAAICLSAFALDRVRAAGSAARSEWGLGLRNATRRTGRSLAVIGIMAAGVFMVVAVNAFRLGSEGDSGTGGFPLIGESTLPVYQDLNSPADRDDLGLDEIDPGDFFAIPLRVRQGDEASCLNLNRAQQPRVVGVDPQMMADRSQFVFQQEEQSGSGWAALAGQAEGGAIPAIADANSAMWALGKMLGDTVEYRDATGQALRFRLVGLLAGSVLQGNLIVSEANFIKAFPEAGGHQMFLIDIAPGERGAIGGDLVRMLEDRGFALIDARERLAAFNAVQNTYIQIFSTLGGFGVLLGTAGLGLIVARNVLERRAELGVMQAVGFRRAALARMVLGEHWFLHLAGLVAGAAAAAVAVCPASASPAAGSPPDSSPRCSAASSPAASPSAGSPPAPRSAAISSPRFGRSEHVVKCWLSVKA
ncbi:MAG: ABC transporter permease [Verrucomicrobiales bacterium]